MSRQPRLSLDGHLHHVMLRGLNRQRVFVDDADRVTLLDVLARQAREHGVDLHAWVLMPDHVHLLLTPVREQALPRFMQAVGRQYVQAFNRRHQRNGTLWDGRYRSTVLQPDPWLLRCMVWMDTHPARAGLTDADGPALGAYPWSTAGHYLGVRSERTVVVPAQVWGLGNTPFAREAAYRRLLEQGAAAAWQAELTDAALKGWVLGAPAFVAELQTQTPRRLQKGRPGRPSRLL